MSVYIKHEHLSFPGIRKSDAARRSLGITFEIMDNFTNYSQLIPKRMYDLMQGTRKKDEKGKINSVKSVQK